MSATARQLQALTALKNAKPGVSLRELGEKLDIHHVSVLQMLQRLEKRGLVKLKPTRVVTEKGLEALRTATADLRASLSAVA